MDRIASCARAMTKTWRRAGQAFNQPEQGRNDPLVAAVIHAARHDQRQFHRLATM